MLPSKIQRGARSRGRGGATGATAATDAPDEPGDRRLAAIGYWFNPHAPTERPRPQALVGRWSPARRAAVVAYLRAGATFERYPGGTFCRFGCGVDAAALGRRDLFDGAWVWPEGLAHYVEAHGVRLPERFVRRALAREGAAAPARPRRRDGMIDERGWIAWARARGAVPTLTGWALPDFAARAPLEAELRAALGAGRGRDAIELVLWRPGRGALVGARADGALVIVKPGRPPRVRWLAGWDAWPAA